MRERRFRFGRLLVGASLSALGHHGLAWADTSGGTSGTDAKLEPPSAGGTLTSVGPGPGSGRRSIAAAGVGGESPALAKAQAATVAAPEKSAQPAPPKSHKQGRPPRSPSPTLPEGAARTEPNHAARRAVAGGPTAEERRAGTDDPELRALREAERVLFPRPLEGFTSGFSWEFGSESNEPELDRSGLPPSSRVKPEDGSASAPPAWLRSLAMPDLPVRFEARVVKYLEFYRDSARGQAIARAWAKKSGKYTAAIRAELARAGLPTDLVWLSLIESGHNPTIYSPAGAAGLWQFVPDSGRMYGLTVDRWVDERLDPERSTQAAIRYLSDLHQRFGSWELAMAAYNMGQGGLARAVRKFNTNDYWELCRFEAGIPWETTLYVPKIFAIAVVMNNKRVFGIHDVVPDPPVSFDTLLVEPGTPLEQAARAAEISTADLLALNPQYLARRAPPGAEGDKEKTARWPVRVPEGKGVGASARLAKSGGLADAKLVSYRMRFGDTLEAVAASYHTSESQLRRLNGVRSGESFGKGTVLLVPGLPDGAAPGRLPEDEVTVVPPRRFHYPDRRRVFYRVLPGDSLSKVADQFTVSRADLVSWNALDTSARLQSGMVLQVFVPKGADLSEVRYLPESETRVLVAGTQAFFDYFEGLNGKKRIVVEARRGDTLRSIGNRYGMSIGWMERVNRRSRNDELKPGDPVVVYAPRHAAGSAELAAGQPLGPVVPPRPEALPSGDEAAAELQPSASNP